MEGWLVVKADALMTHVRIGYTLRARFVPTAATPARLILSATGVEVILKGCKAWVTNGHLRAMAKAPTLVASGRRRPWGLATL